MEGLAQGLYRFWSDRILDGISMKGERETKACYVVEAVGRWGLVWRGIYPPGGARETRLNEGLENHTGKLSHHVIREYKKVHQVSLPCNCQLFLIVSSNSSIP